MSDTGLNLPVLFYIPHLKSCTRGGLFLGSKKKVQTGTGEERKDIYYSGLLRRTLNSRLISGKYFMFVLCGKRENSLLFSVNIYASGMF